MTVDGKSVYVVQNDPECPPGLLGAFLSDSGIPFQTLRADRGPLPKPVPEMAALVVLGGSMNAFDPRLETTKAWTREALRREVPFLGICLGGQVLAEVLGGPVALNRRGELGVGSVALTPSGSGDPLFAGIPERFLSFQWHDDAFTTPEDGVRLAVGDVCPHQAFRWGRRAYGTQFHPEVDESIITLWSDRASYSKEDREAVLEPFRRHEAAYQETARTLFGNFFRL